MRIGSVTLLSLALSCAARPQPESAVPIDHAAEASAAADVADVPVHRDPERDAAFLGGFFPIGVFGQPAEAMEEWTRLGCNTMLGVPQGHDVEAWDRAAQRLGLSMIRRPLPDPSRDIGRKDLLAWFLPDEPDVEANNAPCGGNCVDLVEKLHAEWRRVDPRREIMVNLAGPNVLLPAACDYCNGPGDEPSKAECYPGNDRCYPRILESATWVGQDIYPVTGWLPSEQFRDDVTLVGKALDRIRAWTDKPLFAIVEISDQRLGQPGTGRRGPTPHEVRAQIWIAILHGARGIFYFPQAFNPFQWEAVAPDVRAEMRAQHARIAGLGAVLQSEIDPPTMRVSADAPLEVGWRQARGKTWLFVLETSGKPVTGRVRVEGATGEAQVEGESRTLSLEGGQLADAFTPFQLHIYTLPRAPE